MKIEEKPSTLSLISLFYLLWKFSLQKNIKLIIILFDRCMFMIEKKYHGIVAWCRYLWRCFYFRMCKVHEPTYFLVKICTFQSDTDLRVGFKPFYHTTIFTHQFINITSSCACINMHIGFDVFMDDVKEKNMFWAQIAEESCAVFRGEQWVAPEKRCYCIYHQTPIKLIPTKHMSKYKQPSLWLSFFSASGYYWNWAFAKCLKSFFYKCKFL